MKKTQRNRLILLSLVAAIAVVYAILDRPSKQSAPQQASTSSHSSAPQTFHDIPPEGIGGDPILNRQKNRWAAPDSLKEYSIANIFEFPHQELDIAGKKHRENWSAAAMAQADQAERLGVRVEGYLIAVKQTGPETCNGKNDSLRDFHIWIGASADDSKSSGLIVEMTPYYKELHPEWRLRYLQALCERHSKVRVSGWVLWDEEHPEEMDRSRGSQWEIHPVSKFEIFTSGSWNDLREDVSER
jgi:hypothetical protein